MQKKLVLFFFFNPPPLQKVTMQRSPLDIDTSHENGVEYPEQLSKQTKQSEKKKIKIVRHTGNCGTLTQSGFLHCQLVCLHRDANCRKQTHTTRLE